MNDRTVAGVGGPSWSASSAGNLQKREANGPGSGSKVVYNGRTVIYFDTDRVLFS